MKWAREHGCPWEVNVTCRRAASGGHLNVLEWLIATGADVNYTFEDDEDDDDGDGDGKAPLQSGVPKTDTWML